MDIKNLTDIQVSLLLKEMYSKDYLKVSSPLAYIIGSNEAMFIAALKYKENLFVDDNDWFFNIAKDLERCSGLSEYQQRKATNKLIDLGIIKTKLQGSPPRKHFKINERKLLQLQMECRKAYEPDIKKNTSPMLRNSTFKTKETKHYTTKVNTKGNTYPKVLKKNKQKKESENKTPNAKEPLKRNKFVKNKPSKFVRSKKKTPALKVESPDPIKILFDKFWKAYPNKKEEKISFEVFSDMYKAKKLPSIDKLVSIVETWKESKDVWASPKFTHKAKNWLKNESWKDKVWATTEDFYPLAGKDPECQSFIKAATIALAKGQYIVSDSFLQTPEKLLYDLNEIRKYFYNEIAWPQKHHICDRDKVNGYKRPYNFFVNLVYYLDHTYKNITKLDSLPAKGAIFQGYLKDVGDDCGCPIN